MKYLNISKIKNKILSILDDILYWIRCKVANFLYFIGIKPTCSTFIDEVSITLGYGKLGRLGDWQYPLGRKIIKKEFNGNLQWPKD